MDSAQRDGSNALNSISCYATDACVAADADGNIVDITITPPLCRSSAALTLSEMPSPPPPAPGLVALWFPMLISGKRMARPSPAPRPQLTP